MFPCLFGVCYVNTQNYSQQQHCCDMITGKYSTLPPAFTKVNKSFLRILITLKTGLGLLQDLREEF